jgi:hypothetical protein
MITNAICFIDNTTTPMNSLIDPDGKTGWVVRYLWIQHRFDNESFVKNYFVEGNNTGLNVRKQTTHLQEKWKNHNEAFNQSAQNGDLVWRVKSFNLVSNSIDYIEIWKDLKTVERIFDEDPTLDNGQTWNKTDKQDLGQGVWDAGFVVRHFRPYQNISKHQAVTEYNKFLERFRSKDNCIINTPWKLDLNPV